MSVTLPYLSAPGSIATALERIRAASTPEKVTLDFIKTKLQFKAGTGNALLPFLKKIGFVNSDGAPSSLYKSFRNPSDSGRAAAEALKIGYKSLFEINEYAHELSDIELRGAIIQITGYEKTSLLLKLTVNTFKNLKKFADFEAKTDIAKQIETEHPPLAPKGETEKHIQSHKRLGMNLMYTINLNLPATSDSSVFNAIFKSLKENLIKDEGE